MIGTSLALLIGGLAAGGASIASAKIGSNAAKGAAGVQKDAADQSVALQRDIFNRQQSNLEPWRKAGESALEQLNALLAPGGKLREEYGQFKEPAAFDQKSVQFDPGYEYRMKASNDAIQAWAASRGSLFSGGTGMKLIRNAQDMTSQEYGNAFGRQYGQYQDAYSRALQAYGTNRENFLTNQSNEYNRLAGVAGIGQQATGQENAALGQMGTDVSNTIQGGANADAAGRVGSANQWSSAISNIGNMFSNSALLAAILGKPGGSQTFLNNKMDNTYGILAPGYARGTA